MLYTVHNMGIDNSTAPSLDQHSAPPKPLAEIIQSVPIKSNPDLVNVLEYNGQSRPELQGVISYIQDMAGELGFEPGSRPAVKDIVAKICNMRTGAASLTQIFEVLEADKRPNLPRDEIKDQLIQLAELAKRTIAVKLAKNIATSSTPLEGFGYTGAEKALENGPNLTLQIHEHVGPHGLDTITAVYPEGDQEVKEQVNDSLESFLTVWNSLRCTEEKRSVRILFFKMTDGTKVRPFANMTMNPEVVIDLNDPNFLSYITHEAVHAALGETGQPLSPDFAEGCATRLEFAFQPHDKQAVFGNYLPELIRKKIEQGNQVRSSTTLLSMEDAPTDAYSVDVMKYVFGYVLVDTLLKNQKYRSLSESRAAETGRPYQLLMDLNKAMAEYPADQVATVRSRDVVVVGLTKVGYSYAEITQFFAEMDSAFESLPTVLANEYTQGSLQN